MTAAHVPSTFAAYLMAAGLRAGYNLGPAGGDRRRFALAAGLDPSNLTRMLNGDRIPGVTFIRPIADVLGVDPVEVLAAADGLTDEELRRIPTPIRTRYSVLIAAEELGIPDEDRDLFVTMVEGMRRRKAA